VKSALRDRRPSLGVVAISYNEERDIVGFLRNLDGWVDEIVIVDDGSSDSTAEIAAAAGPHVKFLASPRAGGEYFSHQRNKGISASIADWLLHMDIDERVTPELAEEILSAIRKPGLKAYRFRRLNYFMHRPMRGGGWADWNLTHLARRQNLRFGGMFHEDCLVDATEGETGQLSNFMVHLNEDRFEKRLNKSSVYLEEATIKLDKKARRVTWLDIVGRTGWVFTRKYILKKGFRDGTPGLIAAMHSATAVFRANALVWDRQNRIEREQLEAELESRWQEGRIRVALKADDQPAE
jgi:glycosyltransferase involved in cell wall biosynthesis